MKPGGDFRGRQWFTAAEIASARSTELPTTARAVNRLAQDQGWAKQEGKARLRRGDGRPAREYHISLLPPAAQARLTLAHAPIAAEPAFEPASKALWDRFELLPQARKNECRRRLAIIEGVEAAERSGHRRGAAVVIAAQGASTRTIFRWLTMLDGVARKDRLPALAADYRATAERTDCHERAWDVLCSDYLRPAKKTFSRCYRDMRKAASAQGWLPIPSERALRRRFEAEVPAGVVTLARGGRDKAKRLYPAQKRTRAHLHAMQAINMDGHELDVFVRVENRIVRMHLLAIQDLYSGMIVAWRLAETENKETVRLAIGDMVDLYGIPEKMLLDNGRAFTSKWISGQTETRYRFKIRDEDPQGILVALGIEIVWAKPYSGQSKPIERAFRDLADAIAKDAFCEGAYTGNRPDAKPENYGNAAIPLDAFAEHVARKIDEHNDQEGRRTETAAGRSFRETFEASLAEPTTIVTQASPSQRSLWMLAADKVRAQKGSGEIHFMDNRYWSAELNEHAGRPVIVRFDPGYLHSSIRVYTLDDRLISIAPCIAPTGFFDQAAARVHARNRAAYLKAIKDQKRLLATMSADELARLMGGDASPMRAKRAVRTKVVRLAGAAPAPAPETMTEEEFEEAFSGGLRVILGGRDGNGP